jgi:hypothetical protein
MTEDASKLFKRGLISADAYGRIKPKKKHSKFAKRAGHNPPKPEFAVSEVTDRYGNTYTLDPTYQAGPTSPLPPYRPAPRAARAADAERPRATRTAPRDRGEPPADAARDVPLPRPRPEATFASRPYGTGEPTFAPLPRQRAALTEPFGGEWQGATMPPRAAAPPLGTTPTMAAPVAPPMPTGIGAGGGYAVPMPSPLPGAYGGGSVLPQQSFPLPQATQDFLARVLGIFGR